MRIFSLCKRYHLSRLDHAFGRADVLLFTDAFLAFDAYQDSTWKNLTRSITRIAVTIH
ncbi:hypothetical protein PANT111_200196 [Pantoea brenneri]|uniref:Uncharacterized protein n=1 Tax=Pantoea brenneri TaxID=472694 RepID=A0AAX3J7K2_9GAMM|nr:hypothetical protein PANT111_200196 [Pantoea brenneri]